MLVKGSKIRLKQAIPNAPFAVGTVMEIDEIGKNTISCSFPGGGGVMSLDELETYFEEVPQKVKRVWTRWINDNVLSGPFMFGKTYRVWIRENGKAVQMKLTDLNGNIIVRSSASCCPEDTFVYEKGCLIALGRALTKLGMK